MAKADKSDETGGSGQPDVSMGIHGGASCGTVVWVGVLSAVRRDNAGYGGIPLGVLKEYLW